MNELYNKRINTQLDKKKKNEFSEMACVFDQEKKKEKKKCKVPVAIWPERAKSFSVKPPRKRTASFSLSSLEKRKKKKKKEIWFVI